MTDDPGAAIITEGEGAYGEAHGGMVGNVLFLDGHVQGKKYDRTHGANGHWAAAWEK